MKVRIHPDLAAASLDAAALIQSVSCDGMRLGVATGSSPLGVYAELRRAHTAGTFSLAGATAWALDEYVGLPAEHPQRYRNVLRAELIHGDATGLTEEALFTPDGLHPNPEAAAREYDREIGTGVDLQILGLGANGHIGFNEPTGSLASRSHVTALTAQTRRDNARFFDDAVDQVPVHCITQGLATILSAGQIVLIAAGESKAEAVAQLVEGPISARWPATALQYHPDVTVCLDTDAASLLTLDDVYTRFEAVTAP